MEDKSGKIKNKWRMIKDEHEIIKYKSKNERCGKRWTMKGER